MKKSILVTAVTVTILATGAFAYNKSGCNMSGQNQQGMGMKKMHMMKQGMHQQKRGSMMKLFRQLNLSAEQQTKLQDIMKNSMQKRESMFTAFSENGFDKDKFIKQAMNKKENMIKLKAQTLEKAYNVLDKKQKSQLRVLMDLQEQKGLQFDRYCNGRG